MQYSHDATRISAFHQTLILLSASWKTRKNTNYAILINRCIHNGISEFQYHMYINVVL